MAESSNDESSDEEDDGTTCKICEIPWIELTEKFGDCMMCDICDDISADDFFFVVIASDHKY